MNTERLEMIFETQEEAISEEVTQIFCSMTEYTGLSHSVRFPGSMDNQRLQHEWSVSEYCNAPYIKPVVECAAREEATFLFSSQDEGRSWWIFDRDCDCKTVAGYQDGYDKVSCGCQGGTFASSRFTFTILYHTPEVGAFLSSFLAPIFIMCTNLFTYLIPPETVESRFSLSSSAIVALVLFHSGMKTQTPLTGVFTFGDYVIAGCYIAIGVSMLVSASILSLKLEGKPHVALTVFRVFRALGPALSISLFYCAFFAPPVSQGMLAFIIVAAVVVYLVSRFSILRGWRRFCAAKNTRKGDSSPARSYQRFGLARCRRDDCRDCCEMLPCCLHSGCRP